MAAELRDNRIELEQIDQVEDALGHHQKWLSSFTDSLVSPALHGKYRSDSLLRVRVGEMDRRFRKWFDQHVYATRNLRLQLDEAGNWLQRVESQAIPSTQVERSWAARQNTFAQHFAECRAVQDGYLSLMDGYASFLAPQTPPETTPAEP